MWYSEIFLSLYSKILDEGLDTNNVPTEDVRQAILHLHEVYRGDPKSLSKESSSLTDYTEIAYRCAYLFKYAPIHTALVYEATCRALVNNPHLRRSVLDSVIGGPLKICCLGAGPGTDVIGVLAAMHDRLGFFPTYVKMVDIVPEWEVTFRSVVKELKSSNGSYGIMSESVSDKWFGWSFLAADLQGKMNQELNKALGTADLITLVKFVSAIACKETLKTIEKVFRVIKPGGLVLFIDNAAGGFQELISSAAHKYKLVLASEPLCHELYVNETFNTEKFGYRSCHTTRVAVQLLMKLDPIEYSTGIHLSKQMPHNQSFYSMPVPPQMFRPEPFNCGMAWYGPSGRMAAPGAPMISTPPMRANGPSGPWAASGARMRGYVGSDTFYSKPKSPGTGGRRNV